MCVLADEQMTALYGNAWYTQTILKDENEGKCLPSSTCSITVRPEREAKKRISEIAESGIPMKMNVINNAYRFVNALVSLGVIPTEDEITYTAYGNIVIDLEARKGLISIEIGTRQIGFFTEFEDGDDYASDGIETDFKSVPPYLSEVILKSW